MRWAEAPVVAVGSVVVVAMGPGAGVGDGPAGGGRAVVEDRRAELGVGGGGPVLVSRRRGSDLSV